MTSLPIQLKPVDVASYSHGYDAMNAFLDGDWFEIALGDDAGGFTQIERYPEGTEFEIHYMTVLSDWTFDRYYPEADRYFTIRFKKPKI